MKFLAFVAASACAPVLGAAFTQEVRERPQPVPLDGPPHYFRLLAGTGRPLEAGTEVSVGVDWYVTDSEWPLADPGGGWDSYRRAVVVFADGRAISPASKYRESPYHRGYLRVQRDGSDRRERAVVPWPVDSSAEAPLEMRLEPEQVLCSGRLVDDLGRAVAAQEVQLDLVNVHPDRPRHVQLSLGERFERRKGTYSILGWPAPGEWKITAMYPYHGPAAKPCKLEIGKGDLDFALPATGIVQIRLTRSIPLDALDATFRHAASGHIRSGSVFGPASNFRLLVGEYALSLELGGRPLLDLGTVKVEHGKELDLPVALPEELRVIRIGITTEEGHSLPAVSARFAGAQAGHLEPYTARCGGIFVTTAQPAVDLVIESPGFELTTVQGVKGDMTVKLKRVAK